MEDRNVKGVAVLAGRLFRRTKGMHVAVGASVRTSGRTVWVVLVTPIRTHCAMLKHRGNLATRTLQLHSMSQAAHPLLLFRQGAEQGMLRQSDAGTAAVLALVSGDQHTHTCSQVRTTAVSIYGALAAFLKLETETWTNAKSTLDKVRLGVHSCMHTAKV